MTFSVKLLSFIGLTVFVSSTMFGTKCYNDRQLFLQNTLSNQSVTFKIYSNMGTEDKTVQANKQDTVEYPADITITKIEVASIIDPATKKALVKEGSWKLTNCSGKDENKFKSLKAQVKARGNDSALLIVTWN